MATDKYRVEHDLLGDRQVAADAYYGVHTLRAMGRTSCRTRCR